MADPLNLFPNRAAIGRADAAGNVYMTLEFSRALAGLMSRVGGPFALGNDDLGTEQATSVGLQLAQTVAELQRQVTVAEQFLAQLAELGKHVATLERAGVEVPPPVDWEHPGKIGAGTASTGKFTDLTATAAVTFKPTGAALVTIKPAAPGQVDNMELGQTTPRPARVVTLNKITFTQPANGATLTLADGATLTVPGAGGTLNTAAYTNAADFAPRGGEYEDWRAGKFGCNGQPPQAPKVSGGTLAGVISALVAFGFLSS